MSCAEPNPPEADPIVTLVVEDEVLIRFALSDYLREQGFKVYEAASGDEAIQLLRFYKTAIDVVFTDIKMPGTMDGLDLMNWIWTNRPDLPVLLTTGDAKSVAAARDLAVDCFVKPYDLQAVVARIRKAGENRRAGA